MTSSRPGVLAVRTINDYRRREIIGFLGVRYYLDSTATRSDDWARLVAPDLVMTRKQPIYFHAEHFKEKSESGKIEHRSIFVPEPNECLAEAALLAECAKHPKIFGNPEYVFSYALNHYECRNGTFLPYTDGLRKRQAAIAKACEAAPNGIVRYTDIQKFYPSISIELAHRSWDEHCRKAHLSEMWYQLGAKLIEGYKTSSMQSKPSLLTGPMFSHLLANLVFRQIDQALSTNLPVRYFRYVDDITLVGKSDDVALSHEIVKERLAVLGFILHGEESPKTLEVPCSEWLASRNDFAIERGSVTWMQLIGNLKRYLLQYPEQRENLHRALRSEGFRIPVRNYSSIIRERDFAISLQRLAPWNWFRRKVRHLSIEGIVDLAKRLRDRLDNDFHQLNYGVSNLTGYERKRRLSKLRYCVARLIYLSADERLQSLADITRAIPELFFHTEVMCAVASCKIDHILSMGTNAAQATAQPLKVVGKAAFSTSRLFQTAKEQSLAVFLINGVTVDRPKPDQVPESELIRFATNGADKSAMSSTNPFLREIACLHGLSSAPRHIEMFDRVFDEDETLTMDAVTQLQQSVT